jgi:hypothetical protein
MEEPMTKFHELDEARANSDKEATKRDRSDVTMMLTILKELADFLECPKDGFKILRIEPNRGAGELYIHQHIIRAHDGRAMSLFGLNLTSGPMEIYMRLKTVGGAYEATCFSVTAKIMDHDKSGRDAFYTRVFESIREYLATRHTMSPDGIAERRAIGFRDPSAEVDRATVQDEVIVLEALSIG